MDDFETFGEFLDGLSKQRVAKLPDSILLVGRTSEGRMQPFQLDEDWRLLVDCATPVYTGRNPVEIPDGAPGLLEPSPDGGTIVVININVVNVTGSPVALTLWLDENDPPSDYFIFGICGGTVPANGYWQWTGELQLQAGYSVWGQAGAANALYAHISLRAPLGSYRLP
jgi:hypothetical protein